MDDKACPTRPREGSREEGEGAGRISYWHSRSKSLVVY